MKLSGKFKEKLGFTLAEVMIVVAILAILTAVAAPNVAKYARSIRLRELNDSARAIYMAAEHKFTADVNKGVKLSESLELKYGDGLEPIADKRYKFEPSTNPDVKIPTMMGYVINRSGDNNKLVNIVESELEENNYIVEFNPETGDVYGVFYSNETDFKDGEYAYNSNYNADSGVYYNAVHDGLKNDKLIGFYGNETIKPDEVGTPVDLQKPKVEIINKEKLVLKITPPSKVGRYHIKADIDGTEIIPASGDCYISGGNPDETIDIILDSLEGGPYKPALSKELSSAGTYEAPIDVWLGKTVFDNCEDVTLTVTFYDEEGKSRDQTVTKTFNPLFANGSGLDKSDPDKNVYAYIEYGRHLQNLEKCNAVTKAVIKNTIDFSNNDPDYQGWKNTYPEGGSYRPFVALAQNKLKEIYAKSGSEIQNIIVNTASDKARVEFVNGAGLFAVVEDMNFHDLKFVNPKIDCDEVGAGVVCGVSLNGSTFENITVVNPIVTSSFPASSCGGLAGYLNARLPLLNDAEVKTETIKNCAIFDSSDGNWENPMADPYFEHVIDSRGAGGYSGGLVGYACALSCDKSYASVKVKAIGSAGGLIGFYANYGTIIPLELTDCFSGGHTYKGEFEGTYIDSGVEKKFDLMDNVSSEVDAGGLVGTIFGTSVNIHGKVFSSCSVSSKRGSDEDAVLHADPAIVATSTNSIKTETNDDVIYVLGEGRITDGATVTEIKKSADTNVKSAEDVLIKDESSFSVGKRYDMKVSSVFKYPVPGDMIMHGDWCNAEDITGFFYWEKHENDYNLRVLSSGKEYDGLCYEQDGLSVTDYGYGAFSVRGDITSTITDDVIKTDEDYEGYKYIVNELRNALKSDDLKDVIGELKDEDNVNVELYIGKSGAEAQKSVTVNGREYTFAPNFCAMKEGKETLGTASAPYEVRTAEHLDNVRYSLSGNYKQSHDIRPVEALKPIGDESEAFSGVYDGGSYRILRGKFISGGSGSAGLFGVTENATLKNIVLFNPADTEGGFSSLIVKGDESTPSAASLNPTALSGGLAIPDESLPAVDGETAPDYASAPYDEALAAVDGGAEEEIVVQKGKWETSPLVNVEGKESAEIYKFKFQSGDEFYELFANNMSYNPEITFSISTTSLIGGFLGNNLKAELHIGYYDGDNWISVLDIGSDDNGWKEDPDNGFLGFFAGSTYGYTLNGKVLFDALQAKSAWGKEIIITYKSTGGINYGKDTNAYLVFNHTHIYGNSENEGNEDYHVKTCTFKDCGRKVGEKHNYVKGHWENVLNSEGHIFTCTVCGYKAPIEAHEIKWTVKDDYGHQGECEICGYTMNNKEPHQFDESRNCTICGYHTEHHYVLKHDDWHHWYECDHTVHYGCTDTTTYQYSDHVFASATPSPTDFSKHVAVCTVCSYEKLEDHNIKCEQIDNNYHKKYCETCGYVIANSEAHNFKSISARTETTHTIKCGDCGYTKTENHIQPSDWTSDDEYHWYVCTDSLCHMAYQKTEHTYVYDASTNKEKCSVCGHVKNHVHSSGKWDTSESEHWHTCDVCGKEYDRDKHTFLTGDHTEEKCSVCGYANPDVKQYLADSADYVGGLIGTAKNTTIENCVVSGYIINGTQAAGGIVGKSSGSKITKCEANVTLEGNGSAGGIVGVTDSDITQSYALIQSVKSGSMADVGGIVGGKEGSSSPNVSNCYSIFSLTISKKRFPIAPDGFNVTDCFYPNSYTFGAGTVKGEAVKIGLLEPTSAESKASALQMSSAQATYASSATEPERQGYPYAAVVTNEVDGSRVVHYGPYTIKKFKEINGEVITGPLVGIYNVRQSGAMDMVSSIGYLSYNRNGKLYSNEYWTGGNELPFDLADARGRYIGLFLEAGKSQDGLSYYVTSNGDTSKAMLVPFKEIYNKDFDYLKQSVMFYTTQGKLTGVDIYHWLDENNWNNSKATARFEYFVLCDVDTGRPLPIYNDTTIDVEYTNLETGKTGNVLHATGPMFKTEFIKTDLDDKPVPEVTIFRSAPYNQSNLLEQIYDDKIGGWYNISSDENSIIGVILPASYREEIENGHIRFLYGNEPIGFGEDGVRFWRETEDGVLGDIVDGKFEPIEIPDDKIVLRIASGKGISNGTQGAGENVYNCFKVDVLYGTRIIASKGINFWKGQEMETLEEYNTHEEYTPLVGIFNRRIGEYGNNSIVMTYNEDGYTFTNKADSSVLGFNADKCTKVYGIFLRYGDQPEITGVTVKIDGVTQKIAVENYAANLNNDIWTETEFKRTDGSSVKKQIARTFTLYQLDSPTITPDSKIDVYIGETLMLSLTGADIGA